MGPVSLFFALLFLFAPEWADAGMPPAGGQDMALIPAGEYFMGSRDNGEYPPEESPRHRVDLDAFFMDKYEVTNEEYAAFLNAVKSKAGADFEKERQTLVVIRNDLAMEERREWWPTEVLLEDGVYRAASGFEKYPVFGVSWAGAGRYCEWAGKRLPTEAEWEKAGRGGAQDKDFPWGNELPTDGIVFKRVWINNLLPAPVEDVRNYLPNGYGLYNMAGNVSEWCSDWYDHAYYEKSPAKNPQGPESGYSRVIRGGSWASSAIYVRVGARNFSTPERLNSGVGFRCAKDAPGL